jgi:hypothetical protein
MGTSRLRLAAAIPLVAAVLLGCGSDKGEPAKASPGKIVRGETETGMKLTVDTFVVPVSDPVLKKFEVYRVAGHFPGVDYHRAIADNSKGSVPDRIRDVTFAKDVNAVMVGQGAPARYLCDVLKYEWLPEGTKASPKTYQDLLKTACAVPPEQPDGVAPGARASYYLITDRTFSQRGIKTMSVFGPRSEQLK